MSVYIFEWLEASSLAVYIRQSYILFPVIEIIHIIGFIFLTGSAFLFDIRLLGISSQLAVTDLARHLLVWSRRSLLIVIPSGLLLFITQATTLAASDVFGIKLVLIFLAFINAGIFHVRTFRTVSDWNSTASTPLGAKAAAIISIVLWTGVITCGRLIAYL